MNIFRGVDIENLLLLLYNKKDKYDKGMKKSMENKKTLFFSNIVGNVMEDDTNVRFNDYMSEYLIENIDNKYSMVFINAPGLGGEEYYLSNILKCFDKIGITFKDILSIDESTTKQEADDFIERYEKIVYFLMGGNPYTQFKIIQTLDLKEKIKKHEDIVIGFCAGAINLSTYSIITSDEDFDTPDSYIGIGREDICIEPHYNNSNDITRKIELKDFAKKYNTKIYCIPDESIIYFENGKKYEKGNIYYINQ